MNYLWYGLKSGLAHSLDTTICRPELTLTQTLCLTITTLTQTVLTLILILTPCRVLGCRLGWILAQAIIYRDNHLHRLGSVQYSKTSL